ncbi:MAG TPA: VCBS repeat-containing protein, partial [Flavitalea sp.]|nr:VCBS repeat-containing protein [Flavitalea sp.]
MRQSQIRIALIIFCISSWWACKDSGSQTLFTKLDPGKTGIRFSNNLVYSDSLTVLEFEYMFNGAGVAFLDINNDSLQDVILGGNMVPCRLFLNKGNLKFDDITDNAGFKTSGWAYGISVVDINQDGFQDVYICKAGSRLTPPSAMRNVFFINNGNNTFTESAEKMGLAEEGYDIHAAFFDYDKDGDLDMYLLRNAFVNYNRNNSRPKETSGKALSTDKLFRNNGNGTFTNVSMEAGITIEGFGLGVNICDINNDNWPDVYVSNDFLTNDLIWINNQDGTFTNKAPEYLRHTTYNGMGNDVADFNNDGLEDVVVVDMLPPDNKRWKLTMMGNTYDEFQQNINNKYEPQYVRNTLQLNNGNGSFSEVGQLAGIQATEWSWAPLFADFD